MITKVKNINKNQPFIQKILKKRVNIIRIYRKHHKIYTLYFSGETCITFSMLYK